MAEKSPKTVYDTSQQYLGSVYAKALLGAAEKAGTTEAVLEELESLLEDVLTKLPQVRATLESPRIPWEVKERMLSRAFADKMSQELLNFLKVITRRGRFHCLPAVASSLREQYNDLRGRVRVDVRCAAELDGETQELVAARLREALGKDVELVLKVDPAVIGGLVVRVGDTVYDGSVANRLSRLREEMLVKATQRIRDNLEQFATAE